MTTSTLQIAGKDCHHTLRCNRCAVNDDGQLMLASVFGPETAVKAFAAALNEPSFKCRLTLGYQATLSSPRRWVSNNGLVKGDAGYWIYRHRLAFKTIQAVCITKAGGMLPCVSTGALWHELKSSRYTTPLLLDWLPFVERQLKAADLLLELNNWQVSAGLLRATDEELDGIVSRGIERGALRI